MEEKITSTVILSNKSNYEIEEIEEFEEFEEFGEEEEEIQEIEEQDLLALLDEQQDPILVCQKMFNCIDFEQPFSILNTDILTQLYTNGYVYFDDLFSTDAARNIHTFATTHLSDFKLASEHRMENDPFRDRTARTDSIYWLDETKGLGTHDSFSPYFEYIKSITSELTYFVPLKQESEFQLALYSDKGNYERHRDAFPTNDLNDLNQRKITVITYMNPDWQPSNGGSLVIYKKDKIVEEIAPFSGRTVIFFSGAIDHQVSTTFDKNRVAITAWIK